MFLVVSDEEIVGKKFEEGKLQLDLTSPFYKGEGKTRDEVKELMEKAKYLHLTGKNSVALGIELRLVEEKKVLLVAQIAHTQVVIQ